VNHRRVTTSREPFSVACACGAALKYTTLKDAEYNMIEAWWKHAHTGPGHEPVSCAEARDVRVYERRKSKVRSSSTES
jgi:hypothetical protein